MANEKQRVIFGDDGEFLNNVLPGRRKRKRGKSPPSVILVIVIALVIVVGQSIVRNLDLSSLIIKNMVERCPSAPIIGTPSGLVMTATTQQREWDTMAAQVGY